MVAAAAPQQFRGELDRSQSLDYPIPVVGGLAAFPDLGEVLFDNHREAPSRYLALRQRIRATDARDAMASPFAIRARAWSRDEGARQFPGQMRTEVRHRMARWVVVGSGQQCFWCTSCARRLNRCQSI